MKNLIALLGVLAVVSDIFFWLKWRNDYAR